MPTSPPEHSTAEHSSPQHSLPEHSAVEHSTAEHSSPEHSSPEHSSPEHSAAEHSAAEHSAAEHSAVEQPAAEQPAVEEPAVEEPAVEQLAAEEPAAENGDAALADGARAQPRAASGQRLELDVAAERAQARLRVAGAVIVFVAAMALAWSGAGAVGWALLFVSWLIAMVWLGAAWRTRKRLREADRYYLDLSGNGLTLATGGEPESVRWSDVRSVVADEETLVVRVDRVDADPMRIPLLWRGHGIHDLAEMIDERWRVARR